MHLNIAAAIYNYRGINSPLILQHTIRVYIYSALWITEAPGREGGERR